MHRRARGDRMDLRLRTRTGAPLPKEPRPRHPVPVHPGRHPSLRRLRDLPGTVSRSPRGVGRTPSARQKGPERRAVRPLNVENPVREQAVRGVGDRLAGARIRCSSSVAASEFLRRGPDAKCLSFGGTARPACNVHTIVLRVTSGKT